jgi:hypothetical protein
VLNFIHSCCCLHLFTLCINNPKPWKIVSRDLYSNLLHLIFLSNPNLPLLCYLVCPSQYLQPPVSVFTFPLQCAPSLSLSPSTTLNLGKLQTEICTSNLLHLIFSLTLICPCFVIWPVHLNFCNLWLHSLLSLFNEHLC